MMRIKIKIIIRADGHYAVGMGHLSRCIALAKEFREKGCDVLFAVRDHRTAINALEAARMPYRTIERRLEAGAETAFVKALAEKERADIVIVDLRNTPAGYIRALKGGYRLVHVDDFECDGESAADLVVAAESTRKDKKNNAIRGTDYIILQGKFRKYNGMPRVFGGKTGSVVMSFGGGDNAKVFLKAIKALEMAGYKGRSTLILGATFNSGGLLKKTLEQANVKVDVVRNTDRMSDYLRRADLAVISGGLTKYECSCVGTPAVVICQEDIQMGTTSRFARRFGSIVNLGENSGLDGEKIARVFGKLLGNRNKLSELSAKGQKAVDGRGAERVAAKVLSLAQRKIS